MVILMSAPTVLAQNFCKGDFNYNGSVAAEDVTVFLEHFGRSIYSNPCPPDGPAPVAKTGQTTSYTARDDGDLEHGVTWPSPRYEILQDGTFHTLQDNLTGLIWDKTIINDYEDWTIAHTYSCNYSAFFCPETSPGVHERVRIPSIKELLSLVDYNRHGPAVDPIVFSTLFNDSNDTIWSSTTLAGTGSAWFLYLWNGDTGMAGKEDVKNVVCVCGGKEE